MNWEASNLADRKELRGTIQNERLLLAEGNRKKEVIPDKIADWYASLLSHIGDGRELWADYLTNVDQAMPD